MEDSILVFLEGLALWVKPALMWLGVVVIALRSIVKITPTGKDDAIVAKLDKIPLLGGFLSGVASRAPDGRK